MLISLSENKPIFFNERQVDDSLRGLLKVVPVNSAISKFQNVSEIIAIHNTGYLSYLAKAWANHYSIILRPDDIWYLVLSQLTVIIGKNPSAYAFLFTKTPETKTEISVPTFDPTVINPESVIAELRRLVPNNIDLFIPKFTTTTPVMTLCQHIAFCDLVSPYYNYFTYLCGIPNIDIQGTEGDWQKIVETLEALYFIFSRKEEMSEAAIYMEKCHKTAYQLKVAIDMKIESFFNQMVRLARCGSGHQQEMSGWILDFCHRIKQGTQLEGLPSCVSKMHYINLDTQRKFTMYCGLLYSFVKGDFLTPEYDTIVVEDTAECANAAGSQTRNLSY
jgi:hypothetical protein